MKMWPGRGGQMGGPRWPNGRKGDRRLLWPSVWKIFFRSGKIPQFTHDLFQFYQAFATKNFVGWENDSQSWNPCFLGVRSPNQLPKASWLGNLTTKEHVLPKRFLITLCYWRNSLMWVTFLQPFCPKVENHYFWIVRELFAHCGLVLGCKSPESNSLKNIQCSLTLLLPQIHCFLGGVFLLDSYRFRCCACCDLIKHAWRCSARCWRIGVVGWR